MTLNTMTLDPVFRRSLLTALGVGAIATALALASWRFFEFDRALLIYGEALIISLALTSFRFSIWAHRPPTRVLYRQACRMLLQRSGAFGRCQHLLTRSVGYFAFNRFVWKRAKKRWAAHWPIALGCVMAFGIIVPLIYGWVWFETPPDDLHSYQVMAFGVHVRTIPIDGTEAFLMFHGLVWASIPVVVGTCAALSRRLADRGDRATQTFAEDMLPLMILLAIALTGLAMATSYSFLNGAMHSPIAQAHLVLVIGTMLWLPYSKLFHIPQRSLKLAQIVYEYEGQRDGNSACYRCGDSFAAAGQINDLIAIERELGYRYDLAGGKGHYQSVCPKCRRSAFVLAQSKCWQNARGGQEQKRETVLVN